MVDLIEHVVELGPFGSESRDDELIQWSDFLTLSASDRRIVSEVRRGKRLFAVIVSNGRCILFKYAFVNQIRANLSEGSEGYTVFELDFSEHSLFNTNYKPDKNLSKESAVRSPALNFKRELSKYGCLFVLLLQGFITIFFLFEISNLSKLFQDTSYRLELIMENQSKLISDVQVEIESVKNETKDTATNPLKQKN